MPDRVRQSTSSTPNLVVCTNPWCGYPIGELSPDDKRCPCCSTKVGQKYAPFEQKRIRLVGSLFAGIIAVWFLVIGFAASAAGRVWQQYEFVANQTATVIAYYAPLTLTREFALAQLATVTQNAVETSSASIITQTAVRIEETRTVENALYAAGTATAAPLATQAQREIEEANATQTAAAAAEHNARETASAQVDHLTLLGQGIRVVDFSAGTLAGDVTFDPLQGTLAMAVRNIVNEPQLQFQSRGVTREVGLSAGAFFLRWSPLGDWVAFQTVVNNDREVVLFNEAQRREVQTFFGLTGYTAPRPVWSPDGIQLLIAAQEQNRSSLFLFSLDALLNGSIDWPNLQPLASAPFIAAADWSSKNEVAYVVTDLDMSNPRLRIIQGREEGTFEAEAALPLPAGSRVQALRWSPDGRAMLLLVNTASGNTLYLLRFGATADLSLIGGNSIEDIAWVIPELYLYSLANGTLYWQSLYGGPPVSIPTSAKVTWFDWYGNGS